MTEGPVRRTEQAAARAMVAGSPVSRHAARQSAGSRAERLLAMQRGAGNLAVSGMLMRRAKAKGPADPAFADLIGLQVAENGQLLVSRMVWRSLVATMKNRFGKTWSDPSGQAFALEQINDWITLVLKADSTASWDAAEKQLQAVADTVGGWTTPEAKSVAELIGDVKRDAKLSSGRKLFDQVWRLYMEPHVTIVESSVIFNVDTLAKFHGLLRYEKIACHRVAGDLASKWRRASGRSKPRTSPFSIPLAAGVREDPAETRGHVVSYPEPRTMDDRVRRLSKAIDDGWILRVGVMSGTKGAGDKPVTKPEHFLLVYGHRDSKVFRFYDPDTAASVPRGFGHLYYTGAHFSTAPTEADLPVEPNTGKHRSGQKRYQVLTAETL